MSNRTHRSHRRRSSRDRSRSRDEYSSNRHPHHNSRSSTHNNGRYHHRSSYGRRRYDDDRRRYDDDRRRYGDDRRRHDDDRRRYDDGRRHGDNSRRDVRRWRSRSNDRRTKYRERRSRSYKRSSSSSPDEDDVDDSVGHLSNDRPGTLLGSRYEIVKQCGLGTFGKVFTCEDRKTKCRVAVKVIRGIKRYAESAEIEASIIRNVNSRDKENKSMNVQLLDLFKQKSNFESDHVCLVFEQLDVSIYDFMKKNRYRGFLHESIREIARQMLHAVSFLHDMNLTHTDLKPENVLLVDASYDTRQDVTKPRHPYVSCVFFVNPFTDT